jgi:hypothetical protein
MTHYNEMSYCFSDMERHWASALMDNFTMDRFKREWSHSLADGRGTSREDEATSCLQESSEKWVNTHSRNGGGGKAKSDWLRGLSKGKCMMTGQLLGSNNLMEMEAMMMDQREAVLT